MNKRCKLCDGHYNFDSLVIDEYGKEIRVAFTGGSGRANKDNCFRFCPACGERLTAENFGGDMEVGL